MPLMLIGLKDGQYLPTSSLMLIGVAMDRYRETAFAIDKTDNPLRIERAHWSCGFLLIVRTGRIITAHKITLLLG